MDPGTPPGLTRRDIAGTVLIWAVASAIMAISGIAGLEPPPVYSLLVGPDDHMRLIRVLEWLGGAGWHDVMIDRVHPPMGAELHWSRLGDLPVAAIVWLASPFLGDATAILIAVLAAPLLLGLWFLLAMAWTAAAVMRPGTAALAALVTVAMPLMLATQPGRIDHHSLINIGTLLALGAAVRIALGDRRAPPVWIGAGGMAMAMLVAGEALPALVGLLLALGIVWTMRGDAVLSRLRRWAYLLAAMLLIALPVALPPAVWLRTACDGYSIFYLAIVGVVALFWALAPVAATRFAGYAPGLPGWAHRLAGGAAVGTPLLALLLLAFPVCRGGPMAQVPADQWGTWLNFTVGMAPLWELPGPVLLAWLSPIVIGLATGIVMAVKTDDPARRSGILVIVLFGAFYIAVMSVAARASATAVMALLPLYAVLLARLLQRVGAIGPVAIRAPVRAALILAFVFGPLSGHALLDREGAVAAAPDRCLAGDLIPLFPAMNAVPPTVVVAPIMDGQFILTGTHHAILGAPYHRMVAANRAQSRIWLAETEAAARAAMAAVGATMIVLCDRVDHGGAFIDGLREGDAHPDWLVRLAPAADSPYRLFQTIDPP